MSQLLKISYPLCLLLFSVGNLLSQITVLPTGTTSMITEIVALDTIVFVSGRDQFLASCTANCDTLTVLNSPGPLAYKNSQCIPITADSIYLLSTGSFPEHSLLYRSIDGAAQWDTLLDTTGYTTIYLGVFGNSDFIIAKNLYEILRSTDTGQSWTGSSHPLIGPSAGGNFGDSLVILGQSEGIVISTNRGMNWSGEGYLKADPRDIFFLSENLILLVSSGTAGNYLSWRFNGSWGHRNMPVSGYSPYSLFAFDSTEIYIVGSTPGGQTSKILKTTDLGISWSVYETGSFKTLLEIEFINDSIALIGATDGLLLKWNKNDSPVGRSKELSNNSIRMHPNPTHAKQRISFESRHSSALTCTLLDITGKKVAMLFNGTLATGNHAIDVDLSPFPAGLYFYRFEWGESGVEYVKTVRH